MRRADSGAAALWWGGRCRYMRRGLHVVPTHYAVIRTAARSLSSSPPAQARDRQNENDGEEEDGPSRVSDRMKGYEQEYANVIDPSRPSFLRIDGHRFSRFTKPFTKPHDPRIAVAMERTTIDLMENFKARAAYTFSDEITLALAPSLHFPLHHGGKVAKLISIAASFASVRFNHHIMSQEYRPDDEAGKKAHSGLAHFDARVFSLPSYEECLENLLWRGADCMRNSVNALGRFYYSARQMDRKSNGTVLQQLRREHNVEWNDFPDHFKYGIFIKKRLAERRGLNPILGEEVRVMRGEYVRTGLNTIKEEAAGGNESAVARIVMAKYVNQPLGDQCSEDPPEDLDLDPEQAEELRALGEAIARRFMPADYEPIKSST